MNVSGSGMSPVISMTRAGGDPGLSVNVGPTDVQIQGSGNPPVPMNLFATWEVDRCSPSCVPRLCSLTLKKLLVHKELDRDLTSVVIAVKLQGSKRVLRSNEYILPPCGVMETDLELTFSLQYPHFLKRDANKLQIMLQRRKRYKNRTILGYKSLAIGVINMSEVMQHPTEGMKVLDLHSNRKDPTIRVAEISIFSLSSQPIDQEDVTVPPLPKMMGLDMERYWEEEEEEDSYSSEPEGSDEGPGQPNFKQKFVSLLKRFKVNEDPLDVERTSREQEEEEELGLLYDSLDECNNSESGFDIEDNDSVLSTPKPTLRRYFEGISNSGSQTEIGSITGQKGAEKSANTKDADGVRVILPPRSEDSDGRPAAEPAEAAPALSLTPDLSSWDIPERVPHLGSIGRAESQIITSPRLDPKLIRGPRSISMKDRLNPRMFGERGSSQDVERSGGLDPLGYQIPRKSVYDELNEILGSEQQLPESIILLNSQDWQGQYLGQQLLGKQLTVSTCNSADVQAAFNGIITRIQRYCNCNSLMPPPMKVLVAGDQSFLNVVLRSFVEQLAGKTSDWLNYLRFLIVPLGHHPVAKYLASVDSKYSSLFMDTAWRDLFGQVEPPSSDWLDVVGRISQYVEGTSVSHQLPISEAMLTYRQRSAEEDSCQKFVPFIGVVKVGIVEQPLAAAVDENEALVCSPSLLNSSSSPVGSTTMSKDPVCSPPPSPSVTSGLSTSGTVQQGVEVMGLQVDYWQWQGAERKKDGDKRDTAIKNTMKSNFRSLQVSRLPTTGETTVPQCMVMTIVTQEKNKKVMFLSKKPKEKEVESRSQVIEGISRLICTAKNQNTMLRVTIDGVEWNDVKFFQLAAQWPTHVKQFPVGIFSYSKIA
ncbi:phosphofurin acidic cluster sorting protein 1 isoform X2 [Xenopus laevis]|uniref:Phosphofurin acidic cluster sorting protein 1 isoform X2 n=1 Tax=Xenopus laevis TaxID=8355 RepID=A0A8J0V9U9_XENLA|nr:phosphofurin acidic cluster sorting protein 1 isoform X2 [Xenopus laevis]